MNNVKQYTFTLFCCTLAITIVEILVPSSCKKQISYITGLIMLLTVLSPLSEIIDNISIENEEIMQSAINHVDENEILAEQFKNNVYKIVKDKLDSNGIIANDIRIEIIMSDNELKLGSIKVLLNPSDSDKAVYVKQMLEQYLEVEILVSAGGESFYGGET